METVHIDTSHNVALHYEVATIVDRGLAVVLDWLLIIAYCLALGYALDAGSFDPPEWVLVLLFGMPITFYHLACEVGMNGQSLGKRIRKIRVARLDGGQPTFGNYLMRWVLRIADVFGLLGIYVILFNGKGQRLGDIAAGTTVISLRQRVTLSDTLSTDLPADHQVTFPEATRLTDAHARLIKEVLATTSYTRPTMLVKLATRLQQQLALTVQQTPEAFLRTLLRDYLFLTSH